jgi:methionyl aminopeptidase
VGIFVKNDSQIQKMRTASRIVARTHELLEKHIRPGISTGELDKIAEEYIRSQGAEPSFKGYRDYPAATCLSVNNEVIHGIPGLRRLKNGDIISIDIGVYLNKFHSDAARTYPVGEIAPKHKKLIEVTKQSFFEAIRFAKHGNHLNEISTAVEAYVIPFGYTIVQEWCGHGIGSKLHEDPQIPNHSSKKRGPKLVRGMTLAVEPMVNMGRAEVQVLEDNHTVVTADGEYSAHYENTFLITDGEPEIMTV